MFFVGHNATDVFSVRVFWAIILSSSAVYKSHLCTPNLGDIFFFLITSREGKCGPGSSVGITTDYGLDGPGSNSGGDEIFRPSRPALGPTQPPVQWVPGLSRGKVRPGRAADRSPPTSAAIMEE